MLNYLFRIAIETVAESANAKVRPPSRILCLLSDLAVMSILRRVSGEDPASSRLPLRSKYLKSNPVADSSAVYGRYGPLKGWTEPQTLAPRALHRL
jgi:hypothetical protein